MSKQITMDKTMEENIRNYASEIETIENFMEAVRQTVTQYLGYRGNKGFINMIREIFQNSIDELMEDDSPCNHIIVSYDERSHTVIIGDNGRGVPFEAIIRAFSHPHTSRNYTKKKGKFTAGRHGIGSKATNAASSTFIVESYILGEARRVEFIKGAPSTPEPVVIPNKNNIQGTDITFTPSSDVMNEITTTCEDVLVLLKLILPLTKIGAVIEFNGINPNGMVSKEVMVNECGIITDLINKTTTPLIAPIILSKLTGDMKADIAFTYDSNDLIENITAFSNFCPTLGGTHIMGFTDGLTEYFREYMNKIYLNSPKNKLTVNSADIRSGLKCIIAAAHIEPDFSGQSKEILSNPDMKWFVKNLVKEGLDEWVKQNPSSLQKLCKFYKDVAEIRVKSDVDKVKLTAKYQSSVITGLPKKYIKPSGKTNLELVILEGDSASGSAENSRCHRRQGLFPIRGKIPNAFSTLKADFLSNEEIHGILTILGNPPTTGNFKFDLSKCQFQKVIIMCFTGNTKVKLLDGTTRTFEELVELEKQNPGQTYWVYSYDRETNKYAPGAAINPRVTRYTDTLTRVTLDNGHVVECTPDHLFLNRDNVYVQAQDLRIGDSLMPLYTKMGKINGNGDSEPREMVHEDFKWKFTYHMMAEYVTPKPEDPTGYHRHHKDHNKHNNTPSNIEWLSLSEHTEHHSFAVNGYNESDANKEATVTLNQREDVKLLQMRGKIIRMGATLIRDGIVLFAELFTGGLYQELKDRGYVLYSLDKIEEMFSSFDEFEYECLNFELLEEDYNRYKQRNLENLSKGSFKTKRTMILKIFKNIQQLFPNSPITTEAMYMEVKRKVALRAPLFTSIMSYFLNFEDLHDSVATYNHSVINVETVKLETPIPMYDLTVPYYNNFTVATSNDNSSGIIVHNCDGDPDGLSRAMWAFY